MMSKPTGAIFGVLALVAILAIAPSAFAQSSTTVNISAGAGSGPNCSQSNNCFNPDTVTVAPGTTVEWQNNDKVSHTVTSGNPTDNQTGTIFDSSLISSGKSFSFTFNSPGTYNYFCQVHPWMTGQVIVSASAASSTGSMSGMSGSSSSMNMSSGSTTNTTSSTPAQSAPSTTANTTSSTPAQSAPSTTASTSMPSSTTTSSAPATSDQYGSTAPTNTAAPVSTTSTTTTTSTENANPDQMTGWAAGIGIAAVMSGIGIWSAVRRR